MGLFLAYSLIFSAISFAVNWDFDLFGGAGYGRSTVSSQSSTEPKTTQYYGGVALGISPFRIFSLGALSDYRMIQQITDANSSSFGNRTGSRWNQVSPYFDINMGPLRLRGVYQFLGDFELKNRTSTGSTLTYTSPKGYRGEAHICLIRGRERYYKIPGKCLFYGGFHYEQIKFAGEKVDQLPAETLAQPLITKHMGVTFGFGF